MIEEIRVGVGSLRWHDGYEFAQIVYKSPNLKSLKCLSSYYPLLFLTGQCHEKRLALKVSIV